MDTPIYYSRRGGACIGSQFASWPFGKIEISAGSVAVSIMSKTQTLRVAEVLRVEPLGFFAAQEGPGVRIFFRGQQWEDHVDFYSTSARDEVLSVLKHVGFNVVDKPGS